MKVTVVVTSFNYEKFVIECLNSVLAQTYTDIEIIFVDDGSSDNTIELVTNLKIKNLKIINKKNGGQLSALNASLKEINGAIVFFIDADDLYEPNYIEQAVSFYKNQSDIDFLFTGLNYFGEVEESWTPDYNFTAGFTLCRAYFLKDWIGAPTSAISMRTEVLSKILPLDLDSDWRTRADDCLIWGASLVGAKKYFFRSNLVKYRIHNANNFFGKGFNSEYLFKREIAINRMFQVILKKNDIKITPRIVILEYISSSDKNIKQLFYYIRICFVSNFSLLFKSITILRLIKSHFMKQKQD